MNRDTVIASAVGFGIGLIAAIGLWVVPRLMPKSASPTASPTLAAASPTANVNGSVSFDIASPKDGELSKEKAITVSGHTDGDLVTIITPTDQEIVTPQNGNFSAKINLADGANEIVVTSLKKDKSQQGKSVTVFYYVGEEI